MTTVSTEFSAAFRESVRLMVELDRIMRTGDPDGEEADAVRDRMEHPWYAMSSDEQKLVRGLSQDLYTIETTRTISDADHVEASDELAESLHREDWVKSLDLLRREEQMLPPADVAAVRGVCWSSLGEYAAALAFIDEALRLAPTSSQFLAVRWETLIRDQRTGDAARDVADRLVENSLTDSYAFFKAADVLVLHATHSPEGDALRLYQLALEAAHAGLERLPAEALDSELERARVNAYVNLAFSHYQLGDTKQAIAACDQALTFNPAHADALLLRALLTQPVNPQAARADLQRGFGVRLASQLAELPLPGVMSGVGS